MMKVMLSLKIKGAEDRNINHCMTITHFMFAFCNMFIFLPSIYKLQTENFHQDSS
jgi:hypothetical protein